MRYAIFAAAMLAASTAIAAPFARQESTGDWVRLSEKPCEGPIAALLPKIVESLRAGRASFGGKEYAVCWTSEPQRGAVHLYYEDGDQGLVPMAAFHDEADL